MDRKGSRKLLFEGVRIPRQGYRQVLYMSPTPKPKPIERPRWESPPLPAAAPLRFNWTRVLWREPEQLSFAFMEGMPESFTPCSCWGLSREENLWAWWFSVFGDYETKGREALHGLLAGKQNRLRQIWADAAVQARDSSEAYALWLASHGFCNPV